MKAERPLSFCISQTVITWLYPNPDDVRSYEHSVFLGDRGLVVEHAQQPPQKSLAKFASYCPDHYPEEVMIM